MSIKYYTQAQVDELVHILLSPCGDEITERKRKSEMVDDFIKNSSELREFVFAMLNASESGDLDDIEVGVVSDISGGDLSVEHFTEEGEPTDEIGEFWEKLHNLLLCFPLMK